MMRSLYSGVSGLTSHQTRMDVIGNNIANVNTYGFKASRTSFSDIYYQAKRSATGGTATYAGNNESAVGYGVEVSSIDKDMSSSSFQTTNRTLDLAIGGDGFFMTATTTNLGIIEDVNYTRYGGFGVDSAGNLVNTLNRFVLGTNNWTKGYKSGYSKEEMAGRVPADTPTELEVINVNDRAWDAFKDFAEIDFTDVPAKYRITDAAAGTTQTIFSGVDPLDDQNRIAYDRKTLPTALTDDDLASPTTAKTEVAQDYILYNVDGKYVNTQGVVFDPDTGYYTDEDGNYYSYRATTTKDDQGKVSKTYQYTLMKKDATTGKPTATATTNVYTYNDTSKTFERTDALGNTVYADMKMRPIGYSDLKSFSVGSDGVLTATYAGEIRMLARVEVATFTNIEGLLQIGDTAFGESTASGEPNIKVAGTSGAGEIASNKLEMSNVNLAGEFSDMIVTQRGFQANARIITTSDSMLEELVNLKR